MIIRARKSRLNLKKERKLHGEEVILEGRGESDEKSSAPAKTLISEEKVRKVPDEEGKRKAFFERVEGRMPME